jgi:ATP-dependent DNA helicase RecG
VVAARVRVVSVAGEWTPVKRMYVIKARLADATDTIDAVWFGNAQRYIERELLPGTEILISGKVRRSKNRLTFQNPRFEKGEEHRHIGTLAAVYPESGKATSKLLRDLINPVLDVVDQMPDRLPDPVREREGLLPIADALRAVHAPRDLAAAQRGQERIAFEEMFLLQLAAERARRRRLSTAGVVIPYEPAVARELTASLPFTLTTGQRVAAHEVLTDMAGTGPMNRLLQGDVGSGKTVVAAMAALMTTRASFQTAVMAPTEILARQHHATLEALLAPVGLMPRLLVGSTAAKARREILDGLRGGHESLIVGTHALIEDDVVFDNLGLVVVDEQHRFGVAQRQRLRLKAQAMPNFLAMTATPIPRSLHLTLYGDVNVSELREMPPGRRVVETRVVQPDQRERAYDFIRTQIREGRQAFVICPLIEESDKLGVRSATAEHERLGREVFPDLRVDLLHGRMPAREKEETMRRFSGGGSDVLVATSVVEVGVDVPNATIMFIEGAERFGLAQLHQFRGRVGRGEHRSYCFLFETNSDDDGSRRLDAVAATSSGFELAELDLRLRGPGDGAGLRQHGLPEMRAADLLDVALGRRTREAAITWLDEDPDLTAHGPLAEAMHGYSAVFDLD